MNHKLSYQEFLDKKIITAHASGFEIDESEINPILFDFQRALVRWSVNMGRSALFTMTGTGKTFMQCEYARIVTERENIKALILSPLAVSQQTIAEAMKLNIHIEKYGSGSKIQITNYEQLHNVNTLEFDCVILDESSILKNYSGKTRNELIDKFSHCRYKLCCSATPAPNDYMEIGNHSQFLGYMTRSEMLSSYFIHDSGETQTWRLKGHSENDFFRWMASWAAILTKPSDIGFSDTRYILPELKYHELCVKNEIVPEGHLFAANAETLQERRDARRSSISDRIKIASEIVNKSDDIFLIWCDLNAESEALKKAIPGSVEIKGSDSDEHKEKSLIDFSRGKIRCLITKPSIAGHGMNFQICHNMIFVGLSDSFEQYFQAVRRCYRFGQKKNVNVYVVYSSAEGNVIENIKRKENRSLEMYASMVDHTKKYVIENIKHSSIKSVNVHSKKIILPSFIGGINGN